MFRRLFALLVGVPLILLGVLLCLFGVVGFFTDSSTSNRGFAIAVGAVGLVLVALGRKLCKSRTVSPSVGTLIPASSGSMSEFGTRYVSVDPSGLIQVNVQDAGEARLAIKELRVLKKALGVHKRRITDQQKAIRAQYTQKVRLRGSMFRGGRGFGRFLRLMQTAGRDADRAQLAVSLEPFERQKQKIERALNQVDSVITQLEARALRGD